MKKENLKTTEKTKETTNEDQAAMEIDWPDDIESWDIALLDGLEDWDAWDAKEE